MRLRSRLREDAFESLKRGFNLAPKRKRKRQWSIRYELQHGLANVARVRRGQDRKTLGSSTRVSARERWYRTSSSTTTTRGQAVFSSHHPLQLGVQLGFEILNGGSLRRGGIIARSSNPFLSSLVLLFREFPCNFTLISTHALTLAPWLS